MLASSGLWKNRSSILITPKACFILTRLSWLEA